MASSSARPRIESVGNFVLTVDEPPEEVLECQHYDSVIATPSYVEVGSGTGNGNYYGFDLDDDALVMEDEGDSYVLAVAIICEGLNQPGAMTPIVVTLGHHDGFDFDDDGSEEVPDYLKLDGFDCFNGGWRRKTLFDGTGQSYNWHTCAGGDGAMSMAHYIFSGNLAWRAVTQPIPAGTTITFDLGNADDGHPANIVWAAKALLIKNLAPYTSISHGLDDDYEVDAFDEGGALFTFSVGDNARPYPAGTCGIFDGAFGSGDARHANEGTSILQAAETVTVQDWEPPGDGGPSGMDCDCFDSSVSTLANITVTMIPAGGGTYTADIGGLDPSMGDFMGGIMLPGQGFY